MEPKQTHSADEVIQETAGTTTDYLPPKQERALLALLSHPTQKEAAFAAGISETTLWRYIKEPTFKRRLREAGSFAVMHATLRIQKATTDAAAVLEQIMKDKGVPPMARASAAKAIYDRGYRAAENDEIISRLEAHEEFIKAKQDEALIDAAIKEGR